MALHLARGGSAMTVAALLCVATACSDGTSPSGLAVGAPVSGQVLTCQANVQARTVSCAAPSPAVAGDGGSGISADLVLGGQGIFVALRSSNVSYNAGTSTFQADVTVQNLTAQLLGTPDASIVTGVKVFFHSGPTVTSGTGTVTVANADGVGTFLGTDQLYFLYNQTLQTTQVSAAKTWQWAVPSTVLTFTFQVLVDAAAPGQLHAWTAKASIPTARVGASVGVTNGILYVVGGEDDGATVEAYDPVADAWTTKASLPTPRVGIGVGVINGILYAVGGDASFHGAITGTLEAYDPASNT